jgi:CubicO group peptidase (beta-lactamase class C family)
MKAFPKWVLVATVVALGSPAYAQNLPMARPQAADMSAERLARIRPALQKEIDEQRMPGAVVMIARKGKLVYSDAIGFQDKVANKPMPKDAIFEIFSMTKALTSIGAMMLVEEGKIQLADPVGKYLPALAKMEVLVTDKEGKTSREPAKSQMTVQDLLRHTAGLTYGEFTANADIKAVYNDNKLMTGVSRTLTPQQFTEAVSKAPLLREPGTGFEYSISVDVLGRVIEAVSGQRLSVFLDERLFKPLKMRDTAFRIPEKDWGRLAEPLPNQLMLDVKKEYPNDLGGAGAVSTAADYLRFCQMLLNGGTLEGKRYLSPATVRLIASDHLGKLPGSPGRNLLNVDGYTFGLGFAVRQAPGVAGVSGSEGEYSWAGAGGTFFWIDPKEQLAVVMMTQTPNPNRVPHRRILKALVSAAIEK